jgi:hypothetical protein
MRAKYELTCDCGQTHSGEDRRAVEAAMWVHAIKDHGEMLKSFDVPGLTGKLKDWDKRFGTQGAA